METGALCPHFHLEWNQNLEWNGMELETKWHLVNNESLQDLGCNPSQLTYTPLEQYPLPNSRLPSYFMLCTANPRTRALSQ